MSTRIASPAARDYDAPRPAAGEPEVDSLELLQEQRAASTADRDLTDDDGFLLPTADLLLDDGELEEVVPIQAGEFRCTRCFLVLGRQMIAAGGGEVCRDCT